MFMRSLLLGLLLGTLGSILLERSRYRLTVDSAQSSSRSTEATRAERTAQLSGEGEGASASDDLSRLTAAELYRRAQLAGIEGRSGMSKAQLIAALRAVSG
jgi:hypothetical protein